MSNPECNAGIIRRRSNPDRDQEFKELENDLKELKKTVYYQHEIIKGLVESVGKLKDNLNELEFGESV